MEREAERERERQGETVVGVPWICQQNPHSRPAKLEKSPAPLVHAAGNGEIPAKVSGVRGFLLS